MHLRTTAEHLACWLERVGGHWIVEGEPTLRHLPQPVAAGVLADTLRTRRDRLALLAPNECVFPPDTVVGDSDLLHAAHDMNGHSVFQLAWIVEGETLLDSWLVAEHPSLTESGERRLEVTQTGEAMIELLRRELQSGETHIKKR